MTDSGVGGMVRTAAWLDHVCGIETTSIGRAANSPADCTLEMIGAQLFYRISLRGGWVWVDVGSLDELEAPFLFNTPDGPQGWTNLRRFIQALERSGVTSLKKRPIQIGPPGHRDSFVIG